MGETVNIAKMAEKLSKELFAEYQWRRVGTNISWTCEDHDRHGKKTHPSDVVCSATTSPIRRRERGTGAQCRGWRLRAERVIQFANVE